MLLFATFPDACPCSRGHCVLPELGPQGDVGTVAAAGGSCPYPQGVHPELSHAKPHFPDAPVQYQHVLAMQGLEAVWE